MLQGIAAYRATGAEAGRHYWLGMLAEAYGKAGQINEGLTALTEALSLSRLWQQQGKRADAYDVLAPVYGWFTEGFDRRTCRTPTRCWRASHKADRYQA
jgi:hypothetical protein